MLAAAQGIINLGDLREGREYKKVSIKGESQKDSLIAKNEGLSAKIHLSIQEERVSHQSQLVSTHFPPLQKKSFSPLFLGSCMRCFVASFSPPGQKAKLFLLFSPKGQTILPNHYQGYCQ